MRRTEGTTVECSDRRRGAAWFIDFRAPFPVLAVVAVLPATLLVAMVLALDPVRRVARLSPPEALRAE